jgi:F-type H+-transporting ATPase subunit delta
MRLVSSGKRYAQALFELALDRGEPENWRTSLDRAAGIVAEGTLMNILENPKLPVEAKKAILDELLGTMEPLVVNLVYLLMTKGKLRVLGNISRDYERLVDQHHGIARAEVRTAVPLDEKDRERLSALFTELVGYRVVINARIDPSILGGFKATIGDVLIDGSIRSSLESLRKDLLEAGR